jgi:hypothetical protein
MQLKEAVETCSSCSEPIRWAELRDLVALLDPPGTHGFYKWFVETVCVSDTEGVRKCYGRLLSKRFHSHGYEHAADFATAVSGLLVQNPGPFSLSVEKFTVLVTLEAEDVGVGMKDVLLASMIDEAYRKVDIARAQSIA